MCLDSSLSYWSSLRFSSVFMPLRALDVFGRFGMMVGGGIAMPNGLHAPEGIRCVWTLLYALLPYA